MNPSHYILMAYFAHSSQALRAATLSKITHYHKGA